MNSDIALINTDTIAETPAAPTETSPAAPVQNDPTPPKPEEPAGYSGMVAVVDGFAHSLESNRKYHKTLRRVRTVHLIGPRLGKGGAPGGIETEPKDVLLLPFEGGPDELVQAPASPQPCVVRFMLHYPNGVLPGSAWRRMPRKWQRYGMKQYEAFFEIRWIHVDGGCGPNSCDCGLPSEFGNLVKFEVVGFAEPMSPEQLARLDANPTSAECEESKKSAAINQAASHDA